MKTLQIHPDDNVAVALEELSAGDGFAVETVPAAHKISLRNIPMGEQIIKYGHPIGRATQDIPTGSWVHSHNTATNLGELLTYSYHPQPDENAIAEKMVQHTFQGYRRPDGRVGTRNEIWVLPTVSCVNRNAQIIAQEAKMRWGGTANIDAFLALPHPYGCSQMGEDQKQTQRILANLVDHPNAGGVLVLGLGCENNHIAEFQRVLEKWDPQRVRFVEAQGVEDEIEVGLAAVEQLTAFASQTPRSKCPLSDLTLGLKCGGSDAFSGITANPLVGVATERIIAMGGSAVLTEVPEMFGAETILMDRARDKEVFHSIVRMINDFKQYYIDHNQVVYDNPSPGNKKGGITTLEEKSLGCIQKGGHSKVNGVLPYAGQVSEKGLNLLAGPGNDMIAVTTLAAAGCQLILFTTGRGTPLGTVVPTYKIATNSALYQRKSNWMDFDAGRLLTGMTMARLADELVQEIIAVASGQPTKADAMGFREIALFKNGVIL